MFECKYSAISATRTLREQHSAISATRTLREQLSANLSYVRAVKAVPQTRRLCHKALRCEGSALPLC
ncbi:MAG: hypothetical protein F6K55_12600 [Moorea sp. SIO4A3]|nr:hypothetical protein [Moorena sp. SIO4A3]